MSDRRKDGTQRLDSHGDVQEVGSEEEVIVVPQEGHHHVPAQIQERLKGSESGNMEGCLRARADAVSTREYLSAPEQEGTREQISYRRLTAMARMFPGQGTRGLRIGLGSGSPGHIPTLGALLELSPHSDSFLPCGTLSNHSPPHVVCENDSKLPDLVFDIDGHDPEGKARETARCLGVKALAMSPGLPLAEVTLSPCQQARRRVGFALIVGCDLQRGQIHAQQLRNPLPPEDVPVFV